MGKVDEKVEKMPWKLEAKKKIGTNEPEHTRREEHSTRGLNNASIQREENAGRKKIASLNAWEIQTHGEIRTHLEL